MPPPRAREPPARRTVRSESDQRLERPSRRQEDASRRALSQAAGGRAKQARQTLERRKRSFKEELRDLKEEVHLVSQDSTSRQRLDRIDRDSERMTTRLEQIVQMFDKCIEAEEDPEAGEDLELELADFEEWAREELRALRGDLWKWYRKAQAIPSTNHLERVKLPQFSGAANDFF
jgi:hypothetical protein